MTAKRGVNTRASKQVKSNGNGASGETVIGRLLLVVGIVTTIAAVYAALQGPKDQQQQSFMAETEKAFKRIEDRQWYTDRRFDDHQARQHEKEVAAAERRGKSEQAFEDFQKWAYEQVARRDGAMKDLDTRLQMEMRLLDQNMKALVDSADKRLQDEMSRTANLVLKTVERVQAIQDQLQSEKTTNTVEIAKIRGMLEGQKPAEQGK